MGRGQAVALVVAVVVAIAVLGAVLGGGWYGTDRGTNSEGVAFRLPPADGSYAIVVGTYEAKKGFGLFGWEFTHPEWLAQVTLAPPPGCRVPVGGTVRATGDCVGIAVEGELGGISGSNRRTYWILELDVSKECHEALEIGEPWPTTREQCH